MVVGVLTFPSLSARIRRPSISLLTATTALAVAPVSASATTATAAKEASRPTLRVVVADATTGQATVHHAASGRRLAEFTLPGPASGLTTLGDGRHVAASVASRGAIHLVDSGTWTEPHDDHSHTFVSTPRLLDVSLASDRPSHVVAEHDEVVVFGDGSGAADRYSLEALATGRATPVSVKASVPHHGVGLPFGDGLLVSSAPSPAARPDAVLRVDGAGKVVQSFPGCPALHGETSGDDWAAFGCLDGTLLIEGATPVARKLAYPAGAVGRVGTWNRSRTGRHLIGALGTSGVLIVDRKTGTQHVTPIAGVVHAVKTDPSDSAATVLTRDGRLHRVTLATGAVRASASVLAPFAAPTGAPSPKLAVGLGRAVVTEPATGRVAVVRSRDLRLTTAFRGPTTPHQVTVTGAPASAH